MTAKKVSKEIIEKAEKWLTDRYDEETRAAVRNMIDNDRSSIRFRLISRISSAAKTT